MKQLTQKEEEIMERMWDHGPMLVRELQACYDEPRPHVNTLATLMKILEEKGFLGHKAITARCFQYFARSRPAASSILPASAARSTAVALWPTW